MENEEIKKIIKKEVQPYLVGIRNDINENNKQVSEVLEEVKKKSKYEYELEIDNEELRGKDGKTPTKKELVEIIKPLIPKVENGKTPTKSELIELITPLIPPAKKGDDGVVDYSEVERIVAPIFAKDFNKIIKTVVKTDKKLQKQIDDKKFEITDEVITKIIYMLEKRTGSKKLDAKAIKNLGDYVKAFIIQTGGNGTGQSSSSGGGSWGSITGTLSAQTDLQDALNLKANTTDLANLFNKVSDDTDDITDTATNRFTNDTDIARLANTSGTNTGDQDLSGYQLLSEKGASNGYAELDGTGKVPTSQLPSYVDDVVEVADFASLPVTGETGKIYVTLNTNLTYRWSGSAYVEISASLALGETSSTAYRGDRGKIAYDHSQLTSGNPHNVLATEITDFDTEVANNSAVVANTAKVTNATHTGDVTGATALTIANDAVTNAKMANMAQNTIKGRVTASTGDPEDLTASQVRTITETETTTQLNTRDTNNRNRANHTGTQTASTISDFDAEVSNNTDVADNTTARHTHSNKTILDNTTASFTTAQETKLGHISVTQAVDLDQMETDIAALANGMVYKGDWDASVGTFPGSGSAQTGWFYYVTVAGTVDGISFAVGDNIVATVDNASATVYASNWSKHDQTDAVQSVAGKVGAVTLVVADITDAGALASKNTIAGTDIDNNAVGFSKIAQIGTDKLLGRISSGTGNIEEVDFTNLGQAIVSRTTPLDVRNDINAQENLSAISLTPVSVASDDKLFINDTSNSDVLRSTTPQSIIDLKEVISTKTDTAITASDYILFGDATDSDNLKKDTVQGILDLVPAGLPAGSVTGYAGSTLPSGWLWADGSAVSRTTYADLFTAIGTDHGAGDGSTTFNLPDLRGRTIAGKDNMNNTEGTGGGDAGRLTSGSKAGVDGDTLGASGGVQEHLLLWEESGLPNHSHGYFDRYNGSVSRGTGGANTGSASVTGVSVTTSDNTAEDADEAHTNVQPTLVLNYIIKI